MTLSQTPMAHPRTIQAHQCAVSFTLLWKWLLYKMDTIISNLRRTYWQPREFWFISGSLKNPLWAGFWLLVQVGLAASPTMRQVAEQRRIRSGQQWQSRISTVLWTPLLLGFALPESIQLTNFLLPVSIMILILKYTFAKSQNDLLHWHPSLSLSQTFPTEKKQT